MAITMPTIDVTFKQLAASATERSERGYAILIVRDDTDKSFNYKEYNLITDVEEEDYTNKNLQYINDIFTFNPYKVCIVRIDATATEGKTLPTISDALMIVQNNVKTGWITVADGTIEDFETLASWIKGQAVRKKNYKSVCYKLATEPDEKHIVDVESQKVTFNDDRGEQEGLTYLPSLIGILASCNITRSSTYFVCGNLKKVEEVADKDAALQAGKFILFNDGDGVVRIAQGINSMITTNGTTATEDMKFIETVEVMDMIQDDINTVYKDYIGNYKNKYNNQVLLISAINGYFSSLADEDILDSEYENKSDVNVETQRKAWIAVGKEEAKDWTDIQVRKNTFKRKVFLAANIKILGNMTDLDFDINLF
ncbi:hypothetical protein BJV38_004977 [Clostridium beijerinckii]|uniref:phage tail sheath C-terminal domain-containing protein n=1 Tax=Clostridium beijerinckii TaxID=1520 RepID=UPI0015711592|nr:phage tail sheath C-terminal domain-containing protein [Clostridium beijerinckii]NRT32438.1 hypothetical protein [Clostridium beijerinckii]NRT48134.1 hypothetical protein [Clostridium beijerinckii]NRZ23569.1 hypothetical protein [Clostridium beijerinckii]